MRYREVVLEATLRFEVDTDDEDEAVSDALDQVQEVSRHDIDWIPLEVN